MSKHSGPATELDSAGDVTRMSGQIEENPWSGIKPCPPAPSERYSD